MIVKIMLTSLLFSVLALVSAMFEKDTKGKFSALTTMAFSISFVTFVVTFIIEILRWIWL